MNIFITDKCPIKSAKALDDKRLVKLCLETTQLLCTAINESAGKQITPYKSTHKNHSCALWAKENFKNWMWLYDHALYLCNEYTNRFEKIHKCENIIRSLAYPLDYFQPSDSTTPFVNCAANKSKGISYKHITDVTEAYKRYLIDRWNTDIKPVKWTNSRAPNWVTYNRYDKKFILIDDL